MTADQIAEKIGIEKTAMIRARAGISYTLTEAVFAKTLVKAFGEDVFDVIENEPDRLLKLNGLGPKRVERITSGWADQKAIREIMVFLQSHGVGTSRAVRIYKTYGAVPTPCDC